ncbi:MAG: A/G-specific adenine glycosylase [Eubacteriales bacterium]|nr:A/G-specific adenine glycosylase [Eubacteriales bacterium]
MPLLKWYDQNKRSLPWRDKNNGYYTWVSEIMLQQTRVEAVKPYFERFVTALPDIEALSECPEDQLLKLWEGLGYYSRVRNLQAAAKDMKQRFQCQLPADYDDLLSLKGIGRYTAGAIASIAYGIPVPAVDGNVLRVISRITESREDITKDAVKKAVETSLAEIIPKDRPGDFNQALMELGAVICVPNGPAKCSECPVSGFCLACKHGTQADIPVKKQKKPRVKEERTVYVIQDGSRTLIRKRPSKGLLAGLYELPNSLGYKTSEEVLKDVEKMGFVPMHIQKLPEAKHIFSHIEWQMQAYRIRVADADAVRGENWFLVDRGESEESYAIPSAFAAYTKYMIKE